MIRMALLAIVLTGVAGPGAASAGAAPGPRGQEAVWSPGDPLRVRNLSPATHLYGVPHALGRQLPSGVTELTLALEHSNNFTARSDEGLTAVFDGSTTVTTVGLRRGAGERWEWGLDVPLVHHSGGFTDGFIENFHDLFGFPEGDRKPVPRDRLQYRLTDGADTLADVSDSGQHLGDVRAWLGYGLHQVPGRHAVVRAMVELPTGQVSDLSGSESTDVSVWLELVDQRWLAGLNTTLTLSGGMTAPGEGELLPDRQQDLVFSGHLGLHYPLTRRITLRAQLDGHSDVIDSGVGPAAEGALLGTLGGSVDVSASMRLDLGVVEDLTPHRAPDVVFLMTLGARF